MPIKIEHIATYLFFVLRGYRSITRMIHFDDTPT
jgi:hypothetical protein